VGIFDLVFILVFLGSVAGLVSVIIAALRGARKAAFRHLLALGSWLAAYLAVVVTVSLLSPRREFQIGQDECFDDWCVSVEKAQFSTTIGRDRGIRSSRGVFCVATLRVSSRALGRAQAAPDAAVHLIDDRGRNYLPSPEGQQAYETSFGSSIPLGTRLQPGASFQSVRVFELPSDADGLGLVVDHGGWPGRFVIGDGGSLLHKPTVILLPKPGRL
jgi:hypothetical protein